MGVKERLGLPEGKLRREGMARQTLHSQEGEEIAGLDGTKAGRKRAVRPPIQASEFSDGYGVSCYVDGQLRRRGGVS